MTLLKTYSKIMIVRNSMNYLKIVLSIIVTYVMISFTTIYINGMLSLDSVTEYSKLQYVCFSILSILLIAGLTVVIYQFYIVLKSGMKDYRILRSLGATNFLIRLLNLTHTIVLIILSVPIGLFCGFKLTTFLIRLLDSQIYQRLVMESITSLTTLFILSGVISSFIISIGIYLDHNIIRMPLSNLISDSYTISEEV